MHDSFYLFVAAQDPRALLDMSAEEELQAKMQEADFGTATSALTILRYSCFMVATAVLTAPQEVMQSCIECFSVQLSAQKHAGRGWCLQLPVC